MKGWVAAGIVAFIVTLESVAILVALSGAVAGTLALVIVLHNARKLSMFVTEQTSTIGSLRERVEALEPSRPAG